MYCSNCGDMISERAGNCPNCGVKPFRTKAYCYKCGEKNFKKEQEDCKDCGASLNPKIVSASTPINEPWFGSFQSSLKTVKVKLTRE